MQRLKLFIILLILAVPSLFSQEELKTQKFLDLLMSSHYFDAFEYYDRYEVEIGLEDSLVGKTFYHAFKNAALGEYDTAVGHFNDIFNTVSLDSEYPLIETLSSFSFNIQKHHNAAYLFGKLIEIDSVPSISDEQIYDRMKYNIQLRDLCTILQQEEEMKICFGDSSVAVVDFEQSYNVPILQVGVNQHHTRALFDTGVTPPLLMTRQMADSVGVRIICDEFMMSVNNIPTSVTYGILDSLMIDNLVVHNLLTLIWNPGTSDIFNHLDVGVVIGLPLIGQIGEVTFDFENEKLILSTKEESCKDNYNLLMYGGDLYLRASVNDIPHTGYIDTGSSVDEITVSNAFYSIHKDDFGVVKFNYTDTAHFINLKDERSMAVMENLKWSLRGRFPAVDIAEKSRIHLNTSSFEPGVYDAFYGFKFMQRFKKVVFDFNKMEFRPYYDPVWDALRRDAVLESN